MDVPFYFELPINDEKYNRKYRFDFYLGNNVFIEYDGVYHYEKVTVFEESLDKSKSRDENKNDYVNRIKGTLLRIPFNYTNTEILETIQKFLDINNIPYKKLNKLPREVNKLRVRRNKKWTTLSPYLPKSNT